MAQGDARERKWRGNWRMEWVASTLHTTSEHGVSSIITVDAHTSAASSRLNWRPPADLNGLVRFAERRSCFVCQRFRFQIPTRRLVIINHISCVSLESFKGRPWKRRQYFPPKRWHVYSKVHGVMFHSTTTFNTSLPRQIQQIVNIDNNSSTCLSTCVTTKRTANLAHLPVVSCMSQLTVLSGTSRRTMLLNRGPASSDDCTHLSVQHKCVLFFL